MSSTLALVEEWLPAFPVLKTRLDTEFQARFLETLGETQLEKLIAQSPLRDLDKDRLKKLELCPDHPPNAVVQSIILDILVALASVDADLKSICEEPRLQILGITEQVVDDELKLRTRENESNTCCPFCCESVIADAQICRWCHSQIAPTPEINPQAIAFIDKQEWDSAFLKDVILHLAARQHLLGLPADQKILDTLAANGISKEAVMAESESLSKLRADELELNHPRSHFRRQFHKFIANPIDANVKEIKDLVELAFRCREKRRYFEAELICNYAIARAASIQSDCIEIKSLASRELSNLLLEQGEIARAISVNDKFVDSISEIHPGLRDVLGSKAVIKATFDLAFKSGLPASEDLGNTLKEIDIALEEARKTVDSAQAARLDATTPGFGDRSRILETKKIQVLAKIHAQKEEYDQSNKLIRSLLSELGHEWTHNVFRVHCWLQLAENFENQGQTDECEDAHKEALAAGRQVALKSDAMKLHGTRTACHAYAGYLKRSRRLPESEEYYRKAIRANAVILEDNRMRLSHPPVCGAVITAALWRDYAEVLKATEREKEAEHLIQEAEKLSAQYEELKERWETIRASLV